MREMLETFRLPGEAQQISRITENFAEIYFAAEPSKFLKSPSHSHQRSFLNKTRSNRRMLSTFWLSRSSC